MHSRCFGIALGVFTQVVFLITVYFLFYFLRNGARSEELHWPLVDIGLALQFAITHSWMLHPAVKRRLTQYIKPEWYGLTFCLITCSSLALIFLFWRGSSTAVWRLRGWSESAMLTAFYASWASLFYSLWLSGLGYQTGLTPWWNWLRRRPQPRRQLVTHGVYRYLRHPIYLSFLGLIWFTPHMTLDHAALTFVWTVYILVGSYLKDERLAYYSGTAYREYQARVAGYPMVFWGPLGRRRVESSERATVSQVVEATERSKAA